MQFPDTCAPEKFSSDEAAEYWPQKVIKYLEQRIDWVPSTDVVNRTPDPTEAFGNMVGDPQRISCKSVVWNYD